MKDEVMRAETSGLVEWRALAPGEIDHERLWLGAGVATCALTAFALHAGLPHPRCYFHELTGLPCVGCGSTRAVLQLLHGHVGAAFWFNPLTTTLAFLAAAYAVYAALVLTFRLPRIRLRTSPRSLGNGLRIGLVAALVANWWWVIVHGM